MHQFSPCFNVETLSRCPQSGHGICEPSANSFGVGGFGGFGTGTDVGAKGLNSQILATVHTLARIVWHATLASWALLRAPSCLLRFNIWTDCDDENANRSEQRAENKSRFCASFALADGSANKTEMMAVTPSATRNPVSSISVKRNVA